MFVGVISELSVSMSDVPLSRLSMFCRRPSDLRTRYYADKIGDDGTPRRQGNYDWYCGIGVERHPVYEGESLSQVNLEVNGPGKEKKAARDQLRSIRAKVIELAYVNEGEVGKAQLAEATTVVDHEQKHESHGVRRGHWITVRKYKRDMGHSPPRGEVHGREFKGGKIKPAVQVFQNDDSPEESFEQRKIDSVVKRIRLDDSNMQLDEDQLDGVYRDGVKAVMGEQKSKRHVAPMEAIKEARQSQEVEKKPPKCVDASPEEILPSPASAKGAKEEVTDIDSEQAECAEDDKRLELLSQMSAKQKRMVGIAGADQGGRASAGKSSGSKNVTAGQAAGPALQGKSKAKAKAKAKIKVIKPEQMEAARKQMLDTKDCVFDFLKSFLRISGVAHVADIEDSAKASVAKTKSMEDVCNALDNIELLEAARFCEAAAPAAHALMRSWKAFAHACSEKSKLAVMQAWSNCKKHLGPNSQFVHLLGPNIENAVFFACGKDIIKGNVNSFSNKLEFPHAGEQLSTAVLIDDPWDFEKGQAQELQFNFAADVFKKVARRYHPEESELVRVWVRTAEAIGTAEDVEFANTLRNLTILVNYKQHADTDEVKLAYAYANSKCKADVFVKAIWFVLAAQIKAAVDSLGDFGIQKEEQTIEAKLQAALPCIVSSNLPISPVVLLESGVV